MRQITTGGKATNSPKIGEAFPASGRAASGINADFIPGRRIVQSGAIDDFRKASFLLRRLP